MAENDRPMTLSELKAAADLDAVRDLRLQIDRMGGEYRRQRSVGRFFGQVFHAAESWIQMGRAVRMMDRDRVIGLDPILTVEQLLADWLDAAEQLDREPDLGLATGSRFCLFAIETEKARATDPTAEQTLTLTIDEVLWSLYLVDETMNTPPGAVRIPPSPGTDWVTLMAIAPLPGNVRRGLRTGRIFDARNVEMAFGPLRIPTIPSPAPDDDDDFEGTR